LIKWDRTKGRPEPVRALDKVHEFENGEPLVDLRVVAPSIKIVRSQTIPFCRETVASKAEAAGRLLPDGYQLGVTDAWRPLKRQIMIYEFMTRCAKEAYPDRDGPALQRTVNRWVAPPGRKAPPGHCTGAAIDVVLIGPDSEIVDVSAPYGRIQGGPTFIYGLEPHAQRHRFMLYEALIEAGFSNCRDEWWHYSYGDAGWAVRLGLTDCFYGLIEMPDDQYYEEQAIWEENIRQRENPFLERR
jgi:zinc D-Ala-D-Ala dipeptidase